MRGGEIFALIVMLAGAGVLVRAGGFILDNLDDALGEFADSDSRTAALRNEQIHARLTSTEAQR